MEIQNRCLSSAELSNPAVEPTASFNGFSIPKAICQMTNKIVCDLDGTLCITDATLDYSERLPDQEVVDQLVHYKQLGYEIVILTARNMRTFSHNIGKINANTLPAILSWLNEHDIPYDEIHIGKPWCGPDGFYIDDRAVRPSEFKKLDPAGIDALLTSEE